MTIRITHVDMHYRRRRICVRNARSVAAAMDWAEQLFGDAIYLAAIRLHGAPQ